VVKAKDRARGGHRHLLGNLPRPVTDVAKVNAIRYIKFIYIKYPPYSANYQGMNSSSSQDDIGINCTEKKVCCSSIFFIVKYNY